MILTYLDGPSLLWTMEQLEDHLQWMIDLESIYENRDYEIRLARWWIAAKTAWETGAEFPPEPEMDWFKDETGIVGSISDAIKRIS